MKLIAHRGWSQGAGENTLAAFRRAAESGVFGVEFDVRRHPRSGRLVVTHDPPNGDTPVLTFDAALALLASTNLELFVEMKEAGIADAAIAQLAAAGVAERAVVFAFADIARSFPWAAPRRARLGAILLYPWTMHRFMAAYRPDVILLGWDERRRTRFAFKTWWSIFSLEHLARRYGKPIVPGIVRRTDDLAWLSRRGIEMAVADMDFIEDPPDLSASQS
jgi:hypothetical protein